MKHKNILDFNAYIKENFKSDNIFVGYHCTDSVIEGVYNGTIDQHFYIHFPEILSELKDIKSFELNKKIDLLFSAGNKLKNDDLLINDCVNHFKNIGLQCIFTDEATPQSQYGEYCYKVYMKNNKYFKIEDWTGGDVSSMICYLKNENNVILK